jgi:amidohydrolase
LKRRAILLPETSSKKEKRPMDAKSGAHEQFESVREGMIQLSHRIHAHPELGFEEEQASSWLCESLADGGFKVEKGICDLPTAFRARAGSGPLQIAICAEYDSLPGIGHACGHNIIAASAVGAALAAAKVADDLGLTIHVIGTPAEEVGNAGGKILLLERGAFDGIHAAMMVHPAPFDMLQAKIIAASMFEVHCTGKESHASAFPELGVNAADALTIAQTALGLLRQHIRSTDRIHGIVTNGGAAPNVVPAHTSAKYIVRSETLDQLAELRPKVYRCFEAGGLATGAKIAITGGDKPYAEMRHHSAMAAIYGKNSEALGRPFPNLGEWETRPTGSTDMGNVSLAVPSIHPMIGINSLPAVNHQPEFAAHCVSADADKALVDGAMSMAWTCVDLAMNGEVREGLMARGPQ